MNKKMKKQLIFIIFSLLLISLTTISYAASFTPGISSTNVKVGDTITVTVKADNAAGMYSVKISDSSILEVTSGSTSEFLENSSATIKLKAKKAGTATVSVTPSDMTDLDDSTKAVTTGGKTYTVKVTEVTTSAQNKDNSTTNKNTVTTDKNTSSSNKNTSTTTDKKEEITPEKPKEKSTDANLKTLGVRISDSLAKELGVDSNKYDFSGFSKNKTSYNVTVPKNVDSLRVFATAADKNAKVKISGNSGFKVGTDNKIIIEVTAEDGKTTKTYTIKVTQLAEEEEKPGNLIEEEGLYLTKLSIDSASLSPEFSKDIYSYTATLNDVDIEELLVEAEANNEDVKVDISGNKNLVEGENTINIILTLDGTELQTVYQVVVTAHFTEEVVTEVPEENENDGSNDLIGKIKNYAGIAIAVIALIVIAVIVLIILLVRENRKIREEDEEDEEIEYTKAYEYNVYKNDENEFANNDMPRDNFIESLYKQRNGNLEDEDLTEEEKETLEEISKQTEKIFEEKVEGQSVEYTSNEIEEDPLEIRRKRRGKGKHSL